ncbi:hypothetical protein DFH07DRAFT_907412 [Mycena maculata]|uniref:Uncharacterized protein n=1 Tax=Mycena maculata TaxID=230809 RepID=A0AAD7HB72_9AGAR|nr:hypothetical protein DFH07DRAFT_907412 [Mycena maculata]
MMDFNTQLQQPFDVQTTVQLGKNLQEYLKEEGDFEHDSDDDLEERSQASDSEPSGSEHDHPQASTGRKKRHIDLDRPSEWFPWPDKETCVLDILRHVPRCSFSKKQNAAIHWAMLALGLKDLPSDRVMDDIDKALQRMCGVQSIRYSGKLGHVYYVNDLAAIIAQEMANPTVCKNLHFLPEDTRPSLSQAWQAHRWLTELDSELTTPMIRDHNQDFYINEPALLKDGSVFMPIRWFKRDNVVFAQAWKMRWASTTIAGHGWIVEGDREFDVKASELLLSFPSLVQAHASRNIPDPRIIRDYNLTFKISAWKKTDPISGNRWRQLSRGHRVVAFPIWLYCDDTSGNTSKKWNKHNSFLFTAAGLPREYVHLESNIHFLATSNIAPPLEMLDGIVEQLEDCQRRGIWAWDSSNNELVLVIPSVLAMLGDNPMQSEFACHIGFRGKYFCRVCWVKGVPDEDEEEEEEDNQFGDISSATGSETEGTPQAQKKGKKKKNKKKKKDESVADMISRVTQFMSKGRPRNRDESIQELRSQFTAATVVSGQASFKRMKTESGIKDTFQGAFLERIFAVSTKKKRSKVQKQADISAVLQSLPRDITSPVWWIKDLDPHQDTPVEILHVILLGFVNQYFWRDAVARVKKSDKEILISCLSSFNVSGLGISPLSGHTLVNYSGSLTGRDFRAIVQAAPFVLHGLLPTENIELWTSLSAVVTLVWQPHILDLETFTDQLEEAIKHFLDCTCNLTLQWFNKPKFHVILHLPAHIRRFGPAMLFATEGFESFNAIIRSCSVHSNRHSPSHDIASRMAKGNRIRHLLSGGFFPQSEWIQAGKSPLEITKLNSFGSRILGWEGKTTPLEPGVCKGQTQSAVAGVSFPLDISESRRKAFTPTETILANGDVCGAGDWIVWTEVLNQIQHHRIGQVVEVVQIPSSRAHQAGKADFLLVMRAIPGEAHSVYKMRTLSPVRTEHQRVLIKDIKCTVNIQHNCVDNKCQSTRTRVILNEREATAERALQVEHNVPDDMIINTAQMRDAVVLDPFRFRPQSEGVEGEPSRKKFRKSASSTSTMHLANITHHSNSPRVPSGLRQTSTANEEVQTRGHPSIQFSNMYQSTYNYPGP